MLEAQSVANDFLVIRGHPKEGVIISQDILKRSPE